MTAKIHPLTVPAVNASDWWFRGLSNFVVLVLFAMFTGVTAHASDLSTAGGTIAVDAYNNLAATADRSGLVQLFDITQPDHPALLSKFTVHKELNGIALAEDSMLVSGQGGVQILDISNPRSPGLRSEVALGADATVVRVAGNLGYTAFGSTVVLFNIATGEILDRHSYSELAVHDLALSGDHLYVLSADADSPAGLELRKVQIQASLGEPVATFSSGKPEQVGSGPLSLFVADDLVYVGSVIPNAADDVPGLELIKDLGTSFKVSAPPSPINAGIVRPSGAGLLTFSAASIQPERMNRLGVMDISDPTTADPTRTDKVLRTMETSGPVYGFCLYGKYAYVAAGNAGLEVVRFTAADGSREVPAITLSTSSVEETPLAGSLLRLTADVVAGDQIGSVDFYINDQKVASDGNYPYEYRTLDSSDSSSPLMAYACAEDLDGNRSCSSPQDIHAGPSSSFSVVSVTPKAGSQVSHGAQLQISAQFSKPLAPASVSVATIALTRTPGLSKAASPVVVGSVTYSASSRTLVIHPKSDLPPGSYRVVLSPAVQSSTGTRIFGGYSWTFEVTPATITWASATSGSWTVAANWSGGKVPASGDNVVIGKTPGVTVTLSSTTPEVTDLTVGAGNKLNIAGGTLSVTGAGSADTLNLSSGSLAGPGAVTIGTAMNWTGGGIAGTVDIASKAVLSVATGNVTPTGFYLSGGTINNSGTVNQSWDGLGYGMYLYSGSALNNLKGGVWNIVSDVSVAAGDGTTLAFNNNGAFNKTGGANASVFSIPFNGPGALNIASGTLDLNGFYTGKLAAPVAISAGSVLNYAQGGTLDGAKVTGAGTLNFTASAVLTGTYSFTGLTQIKSGSGAVSFEGATTIASLNLISGVLAGPGPVSVTGAMNWTGGGITGTLDIPVGATLNLATGNVTPQGFYISAGVINNSGTVNQSWDGLGYGMYMYSGAVINNLAKATWNITSDVTVAAGDNTTLAFNNYGVFNKNGGANVSTFTIPFNGFGAINISSGTFALNGTYGGTLNSPIAIAAHCTLNYAQGGSLAGGKVTGAGTFNFTSGAAVTGSYAFSGLTQIQSGTGAVSFNAATTIASLNILSGALAGAGPITVTGTTNWTGGGITGTLDIPVKGTFNIATGNVTPTGFYLSGATINNSGTIHQSWDGLGYGMYVYRGSVVNNLAGATWNIASDVAVSVGDSTGNLFNNYGTFNKSGGANTSSFTVPFNSTGAVNLLSGTLALNGVYTGAFTAPISIAAHATLNYGQGGTLGGGKVTGAGTLNFTSGVVLSGAYSFTGLTQINSGTAAVSFNAATSIATLNLISGVLAGSGPVTVSGTMNWTGGGITGVLDIPAAATLNIVIPNVTPSGFYLSGATINNSGTVNHSWVNQGYGMYMYSNSVINNLAGAVWNIKSDVALSVGDATSNIFNNHGALNKSGGANTSTFSVPFNGPGALNLTSGTFSLTGKYTGTLTAPISIGSKCVLDYGQGGTLSAGNVSGAGTFNFTATTDVAGTYNFTGLTQISTGTGAIEFMGTTTIAALNLISGSMGGAGSVTVMTTMNWTGGDLISGTLDIPKTATLNIETPNVTPSGFYMSAAVLNNSGTVNHSWDHEGYGMYLYSGSIVNNLAGAKWNIVTDVAISAGDASAIAFNNSGTIGKTGGVNASTWDICLTGSGALNVDLGTLSLGSYCPTSNLSGPITIAKSAVLNYGQEGTLTGSPAAAVKAVAEKVSFDPGDSLPLASTGGSVTGDGTMNIDDSCNGSCAGASTNLAEDYNITVPVTLNGASLNVTGKSTIDSLTVTSGKIEGLGSLNVTGTLDMSGGTFDLTGSSSMGNFEVSGPTTVVSGTGSIDVSGKMNWSGGSIEGSGSFDVNDLSLSKDSSVSLQLGGRYLAVTADVDLEGNIDFTFAPGTNPVAGDVFKALTFVNAFTGAFGGLSLPSLLSGDTWTTDLNATGLEFSINPPKNGNVIVAGYARPARK